MDKQFPCPKCEFPIIPPFYFCPNCGKKIKDPPFKVNFAKIAGLLLISVLLPPLGFWPGIKLLLNSDRRAQGIGILAIALTVISLVVTVWYSITLINGQIQSMQNQLDLYQNLGI